MTSPLMAMFWEAWQLTYRRFALRLSAAVLSCSLILFYMGHEGLAIPVVVLAAVIQGPFPTMAANSAEDQGGFPFRLGFLRPIPTWLLVSFPMVYFSVLCVLSYLIPILILALIFDFEPPLLPAVASIATFALVLTAMQWWSNSKSARFFAWFALNLVALAGLDLLNQKIAPGEDFNFFSPTTYTFLFLIGIAAIGMAIWGVESQRHRKESTASSNKLGVFFQPLLEGDWNAALSLFSRFVGISCPTSSPAKAEIWRSFTRQASAMLILALLLAITLLMIWSLNTYEEFYTFGMTTIVCVAGLFHLAFRDVYGVRGKQGSTYLSTFDATLVIGSAEFIGLRVLVSVISIFSGIFLYFAVIWIFGPLVSENIDNFNQLLVNVRPISITSFIGWSTVGFAQLVVIGVCLSTLAMFSSVSGKSLSRSLLIKVGVYLLGVTIYGLMVHEPGRIAETFLILMILHVWLFITYLIVSTLGLFRSVLAGKILPPTAVIAGALLWLAYGLLFFALLQDMLQQQGRALNQLAPVIGALLGILFLLPLTAFLLAPWAYDKIRHR